MKYIYKLILVLLGVYFMYDGYSMYTFSARSPEGNMGIGRFFDILFIPITDFHLNTYGISFFVAGIILVMLSFIRIKHKRTIKTIGNS